MTMLTYLYVAMGVIVAFAIVYNLIALQRENR